MNISPIHIPFTTTKNVPLNIQTKTTDGNKDGTIIQNKNSFESEADVRMKVLDEKYRKINEQNKQFENPYAHIWDKYQNPRSPYFRSDLTEIERDAAQHMETTWASNGSGGQYDFRDSAFRDESKLHGGVEVAERKAFNRQKVNEQFKELLEKSKINIPIDAKLTFTIDPNNFMLTVSGTEDKELIGQVEEVLNSALNSRELFVHIIQSRSDDSTQFTREKYEKYNLVREIKNITGYDLKNLKVANGKFVTEDGTDIFEIYKAGLHKNPYNAEGAGIMAGHYGPQLYALAMNGFDSVPDLYLSIDYENGSLYDIGQKESYGTGRTGWIEEWKVSVASV
jgi:predicted RNA-binding protein Jag